MKYNKLDEENCGTKISISEDWLVAKHIGSRGKNIFLNKLFLGFNCVRVILPIPKFNLKGINKSIAFYSEVQILNISAW